MIFKIFFASSISHVNPFCGIRDIGIGVVFWIADYLKITFRIYPLLALPF